MIIMVIIVVIPSRNIIVLIGILISITNDSSNNNKNNDSSTHLTNDIDNLVPWWIGEKIQRLEFKPETCGVPPQTWGLSIKEGGGYNEESGVNPTINDGLPAWGCNQHPKVVVAGLCVCP